MQLIVQINVADDWIWTADLRCQKRPLYQLRHNHFPWLKKQKTVDKLFFTQVYADNYLFPGAGPIKILQA